MAQRIPHYDDLLAAMAESGCPVCRVLAASSDRYINTVLYESVTDVSLRLELHEARGYCRRHMALLKRTGAAQGTAAMMLSVLKTVDRIVADSNLETASSSRLRELARVLDSGRGSSEGQRLASELAPQIDCPVCANEAVMTDHYATTLLDHLLPGSELAAALAASDGLCLPHLRAVVERATPGPSLNTLLTTQREIWHNLMAELEEFLRKSDHRFRHETIGSEGDAWQRAMAAVAGVLTTEQPSARGRPQAGEDETLS